MKISHRAVLTTGAAGVVVLGLGGTWWARTRTATRARAPWQRASEGFGDPRLDVLAFAILAPNPHNMQPWQIRLGDAQQFTVYCDTDRLLPETDLPNRQITIGFGCFLELVRQAAAESGYRAEISYFPDGEPQPTLDERPIAHVELTEDGSVQPHAQFQTILTRRTNRLEFDTDRPVDETSLAAVREATVEGVSAFTASDDDMVQTLRQLTVDAWLAEWSTQATRRESIRVTRIGRAEVDAMPNGLAFDGALNAALAGFGLLSREALDDPASVAYQESYRFYEQSCRTAMAFTWTTTRTNTRRDQLEAGRAWVRMQVAANALGVAFHPLSQALQEFPDMAAHYREAQDLLTVQSGETVQMLARLGYAPNVGPAPREAIESRLITT